MRAVIRPLSDVIDLDAFDPSLLELVLYFLVGSVEAVESLGCVFGRGPIELDTPPENAIVVQLGLLDVADVVILDGQVVIALHLCFPIVEFPRERKLKLEVV